VTYQERKGVVALLIIDHCDRMGYRFSRDWRKDHDKVPLEQMVACMLDELARVGA
jgi:hypothetical protein